MTRPLLIICFTYLSNTSISKTKSDSGRLLQTKDEILFLDRIYAQMFVSIVTDISLGIFLHAECHSGGQYCEQLMPMILSGGPFSHLLMRSILDVVQISW